MPYINLIYLQEFIETLKYWMVDQRFFLPIRLRSEQPEHAFTLCNFNGSKTYEPFRNGFTVKITKIS